MERQGVLLLGHGSRRNVANDGLLKLAELLQENLGMRVLPAFFQFGRPSLAEGVARFVEDGVDRIIIVPAFLFPGVHIEKDIPEEIDGLKAVYGEKVQLIVAPCLGPDPRIAEILGERVRAAAGLDLDGELVNPQDIVARSRNLIEEIVGCEAFQKRFPGSQGEVVRRVVHATGDPGAAYLLRFHPQAIDAGIAALRRGALLFADVRMVKAGINLGALRELKGRVVCYTHHPRVKAIAQAEGLTRALVAVRLFRELLQDNVVVIGNAPTALAEVLRQASQGIRPALVIGTPVGFVGAAEVKARLADQSIPYITMIGSKGGSAVAVAIVNALLALARGQAGL